MKQGVKRTKNSQQAYQDRLRDDKMVWTMKTIAYTEQSTLDAVSLTLSEEFGFGPERQARFRDAFCKKYLEIRKLEKEDTLDAEYSKAKIEAALQACLGKHYEPREIRYDIKVVDSHGNKHQLVWQ